MKEEIRQDGRTILSSEDGFSIRMFFNNLSGKNFSGKAHFPNSEQQSGAKVKFREDNL